MNCTEKNIAVAKAVTEAQAKLAEQINITIGPKSVKQGIRNQIWDFVYDWINGDPALLSSSIPEMVLNNMRAEIDEVYGPGTFSREMLDKGTHTAHGVLKTLKKYKKRLDRLSKTGITSFMRSWWFPATIAKYADKFGITGNAIRKFQNFTDLKEQLFFENKHSLDESYKKLVTFLNDKVVMNFAKDMLNGIDKIDGREVYTKNGEKVILRKGIYAEYDRLWGFETDIGKIELEKIDTTTFSGELIPKLKKVLTAKYANEVVHKLLDGQMRYVKPVNFSELTKEDVAKINRQLLEHDIRKTVEKVTAGIEKREVKKIREPYFHQVNTGEANYVYLMVYRKAGEGGEDWAAVLYSKKDNITGKETYFWNSQDVPGKYGPTKDYFIDDRYRKEAPDVNKIVKKGYYEAGRSDNFGYTINEKGRIIKGSPLKAYTDFSYLMNQPNASAMTDVYRHISTVRENFDPLRASSITYKIDKQLKKQGDKLITLFAVAENRIGKDAFDAILQSYDVRSTLWQDYAGNLHSLNSSFYTTKETYSPHMYEDEVIREMLEKTMKEMEASLMNETDKEKIEEKKKTIEELQRLWEYSSNREVPTEYKDVFTKHRKAFTDPTRRRMDGDVFADYINRNASIIMRNEMMIALLNGVILTHDKYGKNNPALVKSNTDYLVNMYKTTVGDPTKQAHFFGFEYGNQFLVKQLKKLPWNKGKEILPEDVDNMLKRWGSYVNLFGLDWSSAIINRAQSMSYFARVGSAYFKQVHADLYSSDDVVKARTNYIINAGGTRNLMNMLSDVMFTGGQDVDWHSEGTLSLGGWALITLPLALTKAAVTGNIYKAIDALRISGFPFKSVKEYNDLVSLGRKGFIKAIEETRNESAANLKKYLEAWEENRVDELSKGLRKVRRVTEKVRKRKAGYVKQRRVDELAGLFFDLATDTSKDKGIIEKRILRIVPELSNDALRVATTWKLSAMVGQFKGFLAFTGSEQSVRDEIYLSAIYFARDMGYLGSKSKVYTTKDEKGNIIEIDDRLVSDAARYIGRMAVYTHAFGMSEVYLPEAFRGLGKIVMQYKGYFTQQTKLEAKILKSYIDSGKDGENQVLRGLKAINDYYIKPRFFGTDKPQLEMRQQDIEALTLVRTLAMRGTGSMISAFVFDIKVLNYFLNRFGSGMFLRGIRGVESPALSLFLRVFGRVALFAALGDFDDDDKFDFGTSIQALTRILLPPIISIMGEQAINVIKDFVD